MASIKKLYDRVKTLDTEKAAVNAFEMTIDPFVNENRKQLYEGFDKGGGHLRRYRNNKYARVKNEMNPAPGLGNPDLKVTGAFYRGIEAKVAGLTIKIDSIDEKASDLTGKYGKGIFGLGGPFKKEFIDQHLRAAFIREVKKQIRL